MRSPRWQAQRFRPLLLHLRRILVIRNGLELHIVELAVDPFDLADIHVLDHFARLRIDGDRPAFACGWQLLGLHECMEPRHDFFGNPFVNIGRAECPSFNCRPLGLRQEGKAALQVEALQQLLRECVLTSQGLAGLAQAFFPKAAAIVLTPWTLAANQDLAYPSTQGERPADLAEGAQYFAALDALTAEDVEVYRLLVEVAHLVKPLAALHEEPLRSRVLARQQLGQ